MIRISRCASIVLGISCAVGVLLPLGGCASKPEVVPSSGTRTPTSAMQVKLYEKPPKKYEILGTVTVTREEGARWDEKGDANAAFDTAKTKAAALGANGLLMAAQSGEYQYNATAGYHGKFYQVPVRGKQGAAVGVMQAIYVLEE
jgi:hypothetical protein